MRKVTECIASHLEAQRDVVIATILEKSGSAPREAGTKMLVHKDMSIEGTIGGGLLEAMAMKMASTVFETKKYRIEDFELSDTDATQAGMVCGGEVRVLLEYVDALDIPCVDIYHKAHELREEGENFVMITKVSPKSTTILGKDKWICTQTDIYGIENKEISDIAQSLRENFNRTKFHIFTGKERYMIEPCYCTDRLYIVGAGHVSQQIAVLTKEIGMYTAVIDDRVEFSNQERFPTVDAVYVISSYDTLFQEVSIPKNSYIVIVTRGHSFDKAVLAQALRADAKYIGMIGSKSKKNHLYGELLHEGFTQKDLDEVHCPIGVSINAQTPEEIAISIVAELVQVKRS
ncbi:MAG: XdhC family protein [Sulfurospirillaceae bacterium]|nr:XdhC family protein [Sulfurospirillaceae bacterium]